MFPIKYQSPNIEAQTPGFLPIPPHAAFSVVLAEDPTDKALQRLRLADLTDSAIPVALLQLILVRTFANSERLMARDCS